MGWRHIYTSHTDTLTESTVNSWLQSKYKKKHGNLKSWLCQCASFITHTHSTASTSVFFFSKFIFAPKPPQNRRERTEKVCQNQLFKKVNILTTLYRRSPRYTIAELKQLKRWPFSGAYIAYIAFGRVHHCSSTFDHHICACNRLELIHCNW